MKTYKNLTNDELYSQVSLRGDLTELERELLSRLVGTADELAAVEDELDEVASELAGYQERELAVVYGGDDGDDT